MDRRLVVLFLIGLAACGGEPTKPLLDGHADASTPGADAAQDAGFGAQDVAAPGADAGGGDRFDAEVPPFPDIGVDAGRGTDDTGAGQPDLGAIPDAGMDVGLDAGPPPSTDYPLPPVPASCALPARVITYNPNGWGLLLDAFEADPTPCADYYIFLPAIAGNKTMPRAGTAPADVRSRVGRFHAVAEFHWGAWSAVNGMTWYQKGVEFRRRMDAAGYNVARGDTWAINELPTTTRTSATTKANVRQLVNGLYDGPAGARARAGAVFVVGMGQGTSNHSVYKPALKSWLSDAAFWGEMDANVLWWSQEAYPSPANTCVPSAQVGQKALRVNEFTMHAARLATAGGTTSAAARGFFNQAYAPTLTAVWHSDVYGATQITLAQMKNLVSLEIYANRAWAGSHDYPDGRIAIAWDNNAPNSTVAQRQELADRIAAAIAGAYAVNGDAARACSPTGAFTFCGCSVGGATFNTTWAGYDTW